MTNKRFPIVGYQVISYECRTSEIAIKTTKLTIQTAKVCIILMIIATDIGQLWSIEFQTRRIVLTNVDYIITVCSLYVPCTFTI